MHWTGTQWSVGFVVDVTIGQIDATQTIQILFTDARFIRDPILTPTSSVRIEADWFGSGSLDANPVILSSTLDDAGTGQVALVLFNPFPSDLDFNDRLIYFEVSPPFQVPP